jgi:hypothetical protein
MPTKQRTVAKELATTNSTLYTVPTRYTTSVASIIVSNASSSSVSFSLDWYDATTAIYYTIAEAVVLKPNSMLQITDGFFLQAGDAFRGLASVDSVVTVSFSLEENYSVVV